MSTQTFRKQTLISATDWFGGGQRVPYDPATSAMITPVNTAPIFVFERVAGAPAAAAAGRWITLLPGFPDGSYGYAGVNEHLAADPSPRLFIEYVGQGDSDKPQHYPYSTLERADLVEAQWQSHGVRHTFVVAFDYSSLVVLELLARQEERSKRGEPLTTSIDSVFIVNGGLFADAHSHPWQTTPFLKTPLGALSLRFVQQSPWLFAQIMRSAEMFSTSYAVSSAELREEYEVITRRNGAAFLHDGAGFVDEHQAHADRWDLARLYHALHGTVAFCIAGSVEDPYEPKQVQATRARLGAEGIAIRMFPGGHLTTSEYPEPLADAIRELAQQWRSRNE